jgi:excisionase family DNA binding protein
MKRLLTAAEVSGLLHVHKQQVYWLASARRIPSFKIDGVGLRFSEDEILAWLQDARRQVQPVARPPRGRARRLQ